LKTTTQLTLRKRDRKKKVIQFGENLFLGKDTHDTPNIVAHKAPEGHPKVCKSFLFPPQDYSS